MRLRISDSKLRPAFDSVQRLAVARRFASRPLLEDHRPRLDRARGGGIVRVASLSRIGRMGFMPSARPDRAAYRRVCDGASRDLSVCDCALLLPSLSY